MTEDDDLTDEEKIERGMGPETLKDPRKHPLNQGFPFRSSTVTPDTIQAKATVHTPEGMGG